MFNLALMSKHSAHDLLCDRFFRLLSAIQCTLYSFRFVSIFIILQYLALDDVASSSLSSSLCQLQAMLDAISLKHLKRRWLDWQTHSHAQMAFVSVVEWVRVAAAFKRISNFRCTWYKGESFVATVLAFNSQHENKKYMDWLKAWAQWAS